MYAVCPFSHISWIVCLRTIRWSTVEHPLFIPPETKFRGGILDSPCSSVRLSVCPSVCPSVRPSVRPSVGRCPDDNSNSFQWI